jgi:hypothetical protein
MVDPRWTKDQLKLAFYLYCQLPFGKLDSTNPQIADLATRTHSFHWLDGRSCFPIAFIRIPLFWRGTSKTCF